MSSGSIQETSWGKIAGRAIVSLLFGGGALYWASAHIALVPEAWSIADRGALAGALLLQVPYMFVRAFRLQYVLDPLVAQATNGRQDRFDRRTLYASGWISFFVVLALPLKLGELTRPWLLGRAGQPGVALAESVGAVAVERLLDGLLIVALLFGGLELASLRDGAEAADTVRGWGAAFAALFLVGLAFLAWLSYAPESRAALLVLPGALGRTPYASRTRLALTRVGMTTKTLFSGASSRRLIAWSLVYWGITVLQLQWMARACGLPLGVSEAAAMVGILGLSIQLPGGPAQAGTFQLGAAWGLRLFVDDATLAGPGSLFAAVMFAWSIVGTGVFAGAGVLLRRGSPAAPFSPDAPPLEDENRRR